MNNVKYKYGNEIEISFIKASRNEKELLKKFKCGNVYIDKFIRNLSFKDKDTVTYLGIDTNLKKVISAITIACSGIYIERRKKFNIKKDILSAIEIKYFAVNQSYQKMHYSINNNRSLSFNLFQNYLNRITHIARNICGAQKIILYSVPEAITFYKKSDFIVFKKYMLRNENNIVKNCIPMFLSLNK